jgi:hypothetical protein
VEIPLDEIVFLEPPQAFADFPRAYGADAGDRLEISLGGTDNRVEVTEIDDDFLDDTVREPWDPRQDPEAPRRDTVIEWVDVTWEPD